MEFRVKALARMRAPDEIDTPTTLASPRGWIAVLFVAIIIGGGAVWAFAGRLPITIGASGLSASRASVLSDAVGGWSPASGRAGSKVSAGPTVTETSPAARTGRGTVATLAGWPRVGQIVGAGNTVLTVERTEAPTADGRPALRADLAATSAPGMKADSRSRSARRPVRAAEGAVKTVSEYPLDPSIAWAPLGSTRPSS